MDEDDVTVTMEHMRAAKFCSRGVRAFFIKHGLDWDLFLKEGIASSKLTATGDIMAHQVVEVAHGWK